MLVGYNFTEDFTRRCHENFPKRLKQIHSCFSVKSNQFAGKKYRPTDFLKKHTNIVNSCLTHYSQKMNNKHSQVLLVFRKNPRNETTGETPC